MKQRTAVESTLQVVCESVLSNSDDYAVADRMTAVKCFTMSEQSKGILCPSSWYVEAYLQRIVFPLEVSQELRSYHVCSTGAQSEL